MNKIFLLKLLAGTAAILSTAAAFTNKAAAYDYPAKVINAYDHNGNVVSTQIVPDTKYIEIEDIQLEPKTFVVNGSGGTATFTMIPVVGVESYRLRINSLTWPEEERLQTIRTFYIGETEATQELWKAVMGTTSVPVADEQLPATNITWNDVCGEDGFLSRLNKLVQNDPELSKLVNGREFYLPNRWEWEYAVYGGNLYEPYRFSGSSELNLVAWTKSNSDGVLHPVKKLKPNGLGIYDMTGNIWEMCEGIFRNPEGEYMENSRGMGGMCYLYEVTTESGRGFSNFSIDAPGSATRGFRLVLREKTFQPDFNAEQK